MGADWVKALPSTEMASPSLRVWGLVRKDRWQRSTWAEDRNCLGEEEPSQSEQKGLTIWGRKIQVQPNVPYRVTLET